MKKNKVDINTSGSKKVKKRHSHFVLKFFIILICVIIVIPAIAIMALFYVPDSKDGVSANDTDINTMLINKLSKSLAGMEIDENKNKCNLNLKFDEETLDALLMSADSAIGEKTGAGDYMPKMYCYIDGNKYDFYVDLRYSIFKTRVGILTTLTNTDTDILVFQVTGFKLGRLSIPSSWVSKLTSNFISDSTITSALNNYGFYPTVDLGNLKISYDKDQFRKDLGNYIDTKLGNAGDFGLKTLINCVGNHLTANYSGGLKLTLSFGQFGEVTASPSVYKMDFSKDDLDKYNKWIVEFMDNGLLEDDSNGNDALTKNDKAGYLFEYFIKGYEYSSEKVQKYINTLSSTEGLGAEILKKINSNDTISDLKNYNGDDKFYAEKDTDKIFTNEINKIVDEIEKGSLIDNKCFAKVTDENFSKYLHSNEACCKCICYAIKDSEGKHTNTYITFDNLDVKFEEDEENGNEYMNFYMGININGYETNIKIVTKLTNDTSSLTGGIIKLEIPTDEDGNKEIYFGDEKLSSTISADILSLLPTEGDDRFYYSKEDDKSYIIFNFKNELDSLSNAEVTISYKNAQISELFDMSYSLDITPYQKENEATPGELQFLVTLKKKIS